MKKILFLLLTITTIFFISCGDEATKEKETEKTCNPTCETYQKCENEKCELKEGMCESSTDCTDALKPVCEKHECIAETITPECTVNTDCKDKEKPVCKNEVCVAETTTPECTIDADCKDDTKPVCKNEICVPKENTSGCVGLSFDNIVLDDVDTEYGFTTYAEYLDGGDYNISIGFYNNPATPGTYSLGTGINRNFATCDQCVLVYDTQGSEERIFFQERGEIVITRGSSAIGELKGEVISAKLIEVDIDNIDFVSTPVENPGCIEIETGKTWAWDNACTTGEQKCNTQNNIETCNADGTWTITNCVDQLKECTDTSGVFTCEIPSTEVICTANKMACNGDNVSKCNEQGTAWDVVTDCVTDGKVCDSEGLICQTTVTCTEDDDIGNAPLTATLVDTFPYTGNEAYACKDLDDWYKFELAEGDVVDVVVNFDHIDGDIDLLFHRGIPDVIGDTYDQSVISQSGSSDENSNQESITIIPVIEGQAGTYYLQVISTYITSAQLGNDYQIIINKTHP